ncbi:MAG: BACON domain-containing protein [Candidatus Aminicenantes bacterium]
MKVKNTGPDTLEYTIKDDADFYDVDWLEIIPDSGTSSGEVKEHEVRVNKTGMSGREEAYTAKITVSSPEAYNSPQTVDVSLKITKELPPEIEVTPAALSFSGKEGSVSNPSSKSLKIKNTGEQILNYQISDDADWLDVTPKSGSSQGAENTHTVLVDILELSDGTYTGTITITDSKASNSPQTVEVTLTITKKPPPEIWVNPASLSFSAKEGGTNPPSQNIWIRNDGEQTLNYSISDDADWLDVNPTSGSSQGEENTHTVSVNIGGLSPGTHTAAITITDSNAENSPQTVNVTLAISEQPPPEISVTPTSLSFSAQEGGSNPSDQNIGISNSGEQTLSYTISDDADWLDVNPTSGSSQGEENSHTVTVDIKGLSEGNYTGTITISDGNASNSPQTVSVTLNITKQQPPQISVTPTSLSFSAQEGGANPSSQNIRISNSGEQTLNYSISDDANWLDVSPTSGSSQGEENTHTVSVDISGLSAGTHNATITITDGNASNSPQTVSVDLDIQAPQPPQISVTPTSLSFSAQEGGANPSSQNIRISNSGEQTLNYSISDDANWLDVSPTSGSSQGEENTHTVSVDISGLSAGTHNATITITDGNASNSPQTVSVTLQLSAPPTQNEISVSCSPKSGGTDTIVTVTISIKGNTSEIKAFGLDLTYDSNMFKYQSFNNGSLTGSWSGVDANEVSAGKVKVGGWGGTASIPKGSSGSLIEIKLKVTCSGCSSGQTSDICISKFTDDIKGMTTAPGCVTFTYQ